MFLDWERSKRDAERPTMRVGGFSVPGMDSMLFERDVGGWEKSMMIVLDGESVERMRDA